MPELPEVENTVRGLEKRVINRTFKDVWTDTPKIIKKPKSFSSFKKILFQKKIINVFRKGKNIIFELSDNFYLLVHQKLTGHLLVGKWKYDKKNNTWTPLEKGPLNDPVNFFVRVVFILDKGLMIALSDLRKFAKIEVGKKIDLDIGPDILELNEKRFSEIIKKRKGKIKQVLMDQKIVSGIGNIYSDEILITSKVNPFRRADTLTQKELKLISRNAKKILKESIKLGGDSMKDYRLVSGEKGSFQTKHKAYQRQGEKCFYCNGKIKREKIGSRSAHFCPNCQK